MTMILPADILLRCSGRSFVDYGVPVRRLAAPSRGGELGLPTFVRADGSTCATFVGNDGRLHTAAANVLRVQWYDLDGDGIFETPGLLLEGGRTNSCLQSQAWATTPWTSNLCAVTNNAAAAPDGTGTASALVPTAVSSNGHYARQDVTITASEKFAVSFFVKANGYPAIRWVVTDGTNQIVSYFDASAGTQPAGTASGTGVLDGVFFVPLANGWYCLGMWGSGIGATAESFVEVFDTLAHAQSFTAFTGDGTSGVLAWGYQLERASSFPSSYIKTVASTVTRAADALTVAVPFGPQDLTVFARMARPVWADASGDIGSSPRVFQIGVGVPDIRGGGVQASRNWFGYIDTPGADSNYSGAITAGALQTVAWQFKNLLTAGQVAADVGSGYGAFASAATGFAVFGSQTMGIGCSPPGGAELYGGLIDLFVARGLHTKAECQLVP